MGSSRHTALLTAFFCLLAIKSVLGRLQSFEYLKIVPDVILETPKELCTVTFRSGYAARADNKSVSVLDVAGVPAVTWTRQASKLYSLFMIDPDVPSASKAGSLFLHWLVVNIPAGGLVSAGDALAGKLDSTPLPGSGLHRYVFLVFEHNQPIKVDTIDLAAIVARKGFDVRVFAPKYKLGPPVAGNFFLCGLSDLSSYL